MKINASFLLVAAAFFAVGMAVDRIISSPAAKGVPAGEEAARLRTGDSSRSRPMASQSGRIDPEQRAEESRDEGDDGFATSVRQALEALERGGRMDAETANRLLELAPAGRERRRILEHLAHLWGRRDGETAAEWANNLEGVDRRRALESALHGWSEEDPAAAAKYVGQLPVSEQNLHLVHAMTYRWAERDRNAAMEWGASQTEPAKRERAMGGVVSSWSDTDPAAAAIFASSIESNFERDRVLEVAARRWASQDTAAAMEWAQGLPGADRQRATESILREVAEYDPGRAAAMYEELTATLPAESRTAHEYRRMAEEIASVWSSTSPQEAVDWAMGLPESGQIRRAAIGNVAEHWLRIDSMAASEWILQLPAGNVRDAAAERVVGFTVQSDPATAFEWANSLSDEGHSIGQMREVLHRWNSTDPVSARAALDAASVSFEQRRELNEVFGGGQDPSPAEPNGQESE
ncbi:MAG: hypothetical protein ACI9UA_001405 [Pseudoalteromonas tetraodonis]|jgi:hypothetical protein